MSARAATRSWKRREIPKKPIIRSSLMILIFALWSNSSPVDSQTQVGPQTMSDVVVVTDETTNQSTTYVADETSGAIYSLASPAANALAPSQLKLTDFGVFFRSPELSRPSGIAYYNGKLVVCDRQLPAVFEIDTTTKTLNLLLKGDPLRDPTRVAVSQSGRVAVSNDSGKIILYDRSSKLVTVKHQFDSPVRLAFAGEDLFVLDKQGTILIVQAKSLDTGTPVVLPVEMPAKVGNDIAKIIDFAFLNGIYYVVGENQVDAYIRSKGTAIQVFSQPMDSVSLSGIAANKRGIVLKDARNNTLWQLERPIPVTANFGKGSAQSLIFLYEYLLAQKTLPMRKFVATRDYKSFEELLLDQKIIFGGASASTDELVKFVCQLNEYLCLQSHPNSLVQLNQTIRKGQSLSLPDLTYAEVVGYETKDLAGESVKDYLTKAFVFSPNIQSRFTEDFLWSLNELNYGETLEVQLQTKVPGAVVAIPPRKNLAPGTILKVGSEQDSIAGSVDACGNEFNKYAKSKVLNQVAHINNSISGTAAVTQLPRTSVASIFNKRLKQLNIDKVEFQLDYPTVEQGDQKAISAALTAPQHVAGPEPSPTLDPPPTPQPSATPEPRACIQQLIGPTNYLVVDSVKVKSGRYKIFKDGSLIRLTALEIKRLGILGEPDPSGNWSIVVNDPYYVAYRLSSLTNPLGFGNPTIKIIESPRQIRPLGSQDIFGLRAGSLVLPYVSQWQVTFLIKESELTNETSDFSKLKATQKFTALRAEETSRATATIPPNSAPGPNEQLPLETVAANRDALKREINYPSDLNPDQTAVKIGIGEMPCNVDKLHPDFVDQAGQNAWITDPGESLPSDPCVRPTPEPQSRVRTSSEAAVTDHGTHVAGLVGARSNSRAPGLMPFSKLFLVDASSPSSIITSTTRAVERNVFIFNFSFALSDNSPDLKRAIKEQWRSRLFVVAVDNDGTDLSLAASPPVSWMDDIKNNMIGVGSAIGAAGTEYVLGDWRSADGQLARGSSYSRKYVHLLAPGHGIYSTFSGNAYGEETGASQAAPQVTAVAAMLFGKGVREPERIKARLIYTADWFEQLRGKVWGGFLNMNRAVWQPDRNLLITQGDHNLIAAITIDENPDLKLTIKRDGSPMSYNPEGETSIPAAGIKVAFADILRITLLPDNTYRVVYLDSANNNQLRIVINAEIAGRFPCQGLQTWSPPNFVASQCSNSQFGLDVSSVFDYVARVPDSVTFEH